MKTLKIAAKKPLKSVDHGFATTLHAARISLAQGEQPILEHPETKRQIRCIEIKTVVEDDEKFFALSYEEV